MVRCGLKLSTWCSGSGASREVQAKVSHHLFCLRSPGMSYKLTCRWLLLVLGLEARSQERPSYEPRLATTKRNCLDSRSSLSQSATIPAGFYSRSYETSIPGTGTLGWVLSVELGSLITQGGTSKAEIFLPIFNCHMQMWNQPVLHLCLSDQSPCGFFFILFFMGLLSS